MANMRICFVPNDNGAKVIKPQMTEEGGIVQVAGTLASTNIPAIKTYFLGKKQDFEDSYNLENPVPTHTFDYSDAGHDSFCELHIPCTEQEIGGDWNIVNDKRAPLRKSTPVNNDDGSPNITHLTAEMVGFLLEIHDNY